MARKPRGQVMRAFLNGAHLVLGKRLHDEAPFLIGHRGILVPDGDRTGKAAIGDEISAHFLAGNVHIVGFVGRVTVEDTGGFMA